MKTLLIILGTLLAIGTWASDENTTPREIYLIRHAPVAMEKPVLCSSHKAAHLLELYNELPIVTFDPAPVRLLLPDKQLTILTSTLPRAKQTAQILLPSDSLRSNPLFNEYRLGMISVPVLLLPYPAWTGLSRFFWLTYLNNKGEGRIESRKRMKQAVDFLEKQSLQHERIVLVAHGYLIAEMRRELKKRGWNAEINGGNKNLAVSKLTIND
ncbi:histidine phosphatase family protein [Gaoshiqia sediminis]|uniref:Phosphoglycerate mutase family protein n=1 Tax=Gaoshiqia sediminis TaxID=2986998 RepID=A0AA42C9X4_9BACT|nr:histidine phosphatase family protein [Gaoshiqia sediminis]MCW0484606.1 phosphoglycerate mutase family protein [Gaoshiqia sediminis]